MSVATAVLDLPDTEPAPAKPTSGLGEIITGKIAGPRRTVLYGVDGIGKSTFAASAEAPIFVPTEEGVNDIDVAKFPLSRTHEELTRRLQTLATENHAYKTVVIDSLDWLEGIFWKKTCDDNGWATIETPGWGKGYTAVAPLWEELLRALDYLRSKKRMSIVLIAHASTEKIENPEGDNYLKFGLSLHPKTAAPLIREWADEVFFANYKVYTTGADAKQPNKPAKAIGGDERTIRTQAKPYCYAKNRLNMPEEIPLKWSEYRKFWS